MLLCNRKDRGQLYPLTISGFSCLNTASADVPKNLGENLSHPQAQGEGEKSRKRCGHVKPLVRKDILDPELSSELGI